MRVMPSLLGLCVVVSIATSQGRVAFADSGVPATVEGGSHTFKNGGKEMGAGFGGIGRGIKDVFTGRRSKEDFKQGKKIGTGAADVGKGVAGIGRGVGRGIKNGFKKNDK